jgi:hypothetical protein
MSWDYVTREKPCRPAPGGTYVPRRFEDPTCGGSGGGASTWDELTGKPGTFPPDTHHHDDRYYTKGEVDAMVAALDEIDSVLDAEIDQRTFFLGSRL